MGDESSENRVQTVVEHAETRKALDSLNPPKPVPVQEPMASFSMTASAVDSAGRPPTVTAPPLDASADG